MMVTYTDMSGTAPRTDPESHIHNECEIYINISGDASFIVENRIYPVLPGSNIITKPYEYHHCVCHSEKIHKHFWILFSPQGNEEFLDMFFCRKPGEGNHLMLTTEKTEALISLCHEMAEGKGTNAEKYFRFFKLINLLQDAETVNTSNGAYPPDVVFAVNYINRNFAHKITVNGIAKKAGVSVNTLERHFMKILNLSPSAYLRKQRLANAARLLTEGASVTEASEKSGFSDYSGFIALFKKTYAMTPLKYQKNRS